MTIDWDKPIETSNGYPARLISENFRDCDETLMLVQIEHPERSIARTFKKNGRPYWAYEGTIRNRKTKREGWINIYRSGEHGKVRETREEAERVANTDTVATIKIEWEE